MKPDSGYGTPKLVAPSSNVARVPGWNAESPESSPSLSQSVPVPAVQLPESSPAQTVWFASLLNSSTCSGEPVETPLLSPFSLQEDRNHTVPEQACVIKLRLADEVAHVGIDDLPIFPAAGLGGGWR